jgi:hypothetical protein
MFKTLSITYIMAICLFSTTIWLRCQHRQYFPVPSHQCPSIGFNFNFRSEAGLSALGLWYLLIHLIIEFETIYVNMDEATFTMFYYLGLMAVIAFLVAIAYLAIEFVLFLVGKTLRHIVLPITISLLSLLVSLIVTLYGVARKNIIAIVLGILFLMVFFYLGWDENLKEQLYRLGHLVSDYACRYIWACNQNAQQRNQTQRPSPQELVLGLVNRALVMVLNNVGVPH